jgi:hypothetical protein
MATKKQPATRWYDGTTPVEDLSAPEQLAHSVVSQFRDLAPSVERIMDAEITEEQREQALTAFRDSLDQPGDPNRDPRVAIANASA